MPRATRAALRAQELAEEAETAAGIALPPTPTRDRQPLGEISNNTPVKIRMTVFEEKPEEETKPAGKGKKGKGGKKAKKGANAIAEPQMEVLEDDQQSSHSEAAEEASNALRSHDANGASADQVVHDGTASPASLASQEAVKQMLPDAVASPNAEMASLNQSTVQELPTIPGAKQSPTKRLSILDSVEALDAMADEIEQIDAAMPSADSPLASPKQLKKAQVPSKSGSKSKTTSKNAKATTKPSNSKVIDAPQRTPIKKPVKADLVNSAKRSPAVRSAIKPKIATPAEAAAKAPSEAAKKPQSPSKRLSSVHKAPFQPTKSSKPPTRPTFELPGEAVSRKLKEQREERTKREEEEKSKQRQFKARPVPSKQGPEVKMTAASKARLSILGSDGSKPKAAIRTKPTPSSGTVRRQSTLTTQRHASAVPPKRTSPPTANSSAKRGPSIDGNSGPRSATSTKGKQVYGRPLLLASEKEKERKAKEEAAKKARADAAERGRAASREWAEKQKAKKIAEAKTKTVTAC